MKRILEARLLFAVAGATMKNARALARILGEEESVFFAGDRDLAEAGLGQELRARIKQARSRGLHLQEAERCRKMGASVLLYGDSGYPPGLADLPDAPAGLFLKGRLPDLAQPAVAIVGSRRCTPAGGKFARCLGEALAIRDIAVVSGLARGIDAAAMEGAIQGGGGPVGVLGCGLDVIYPRENAKLFAKTAAAGAVVTEFPSSTAPLKAHFPRRNRIIAGLSLGVVVVEASERSGSLITAGHALDQGKTSMAVPGPVNHASFRGSNSLIRDGACVILEPADVLAALYLPDPLPDRPGRRGAREEGPYGGLLEACAAEALTLEELASRAGLSLDETLRAVSQLELEGKIERLPGARFLASGR